MQINTNMASKKINIGKSDSGSPEFAKIMSEITATEIPSKYIERICITYMDGGTIELSGDEVTHPVPVEQRPNWNKARMAGKSIRELKVFIKTEQLEKDINDELMKRLGKYFLQ